jgi:hypothetical protein
MVDSDSESKSNYWYCAEHAIYNKKDGFESVNCSICLTNPFSKRVITLHRPDLVDCLLPVLLVDPSMIGDERILRPLVNAARTKGGVMLVILRLTREERNAERLVKSDSWFDSLLSTNADTLKLLVAMQGHAQI